jgi:hypothetical protein
MHNFSADIPSDCPLPSAVDCFQEVFKLFATFPFDAEECKTQAEMGKAKNVTGQAVCTRHGLSVFPTLEGCLHQMKLFPYLGEHVGVAQLLPQHGKIAATPSNNNPNHMTWWIDVSVQRQSLFKKVDA